MAYEYRTEHKGYATLAEIEPDLNALGAQGWRLLWLVVERGEQEAGKFWYIQAIFEKATP